MPALRVPAKPKKHYHPPRRLYTDKWFGRRFSKATERILGLGIGGQYPVVARELVRVYSVPKAAIGRRADLIVELFKEGRDLRDIAKAIKEKEKNP